MGAGLDVLSAEAIIKVNEAFDSFDIDHSDAIDINECLRHWKGGFGKISALEFMKTVDMDGNGEIEYDEFERFW
jgi:Ca2+-binding EF-hand superfamily protein